MAKQPVYIDPASTLRPPRRRPATLPRPRAAKQVLDRKLWEEGRARIATAALPLFARHGYHATPVRTIANAAGLSVGSIFNYFADKDELLEYILDESQARSEEAVAEAQEEVWRELATIGPGSDAAALFIKVFGRYVEYIDEIRPFTLLAYQEAKSLTRERRAPLLERDQRIREILRQAAKPAVEAGIFPALNLDLRIHFLVMLCHMWAVRHWALGEYRSVTDYLAQLEPVALVLMKAPAPPAS